VLNGSPPAEDDYEILCAIATNVKIPLRKPRLEDPDIQAFCKLRRLATRFSTERRCLRSPARGWLRVAVAGADILQIGSSDADRNAMSDDFDVLADDLAEAADVARDIGVRICSKNWCWALRAPIWKEI
jgi:hypothetical protein